MVPSLYQGDGSFIIPGHDCRVYIFQEAASPTYAPYRSHFTVQSVSLQHLVQRREAILEALYHIFEGFWFSPTELIMTSLFHFEYKVHRRHLTRVESTPLLFPRLLCQVLEHIGFPDEPRIKRRRDCEAVLIFDWWQIMPCSYHLPPPDLAED